MKLYTVAIKDPRINMKKDNPDPNYLKEDNLTRLNIAMPCELNSSLTYELILMKLYTVVVYD